MKCFHCKSDGPEITVAHVRSCAGVRPNAGDRHHEARRDLIAEVRAVSANIPEGHYAVTGEDGTLDFYEVDKPTSGKWAGRTFISIHRSDDTFRLPSIKTELAVFRKIAVDPQNAMLLFGQKTGRCGHCHKLIHKPESVARGMGPHCAKNMGWADVA